MFMQLEEKGVLGFLVLMIWELFWNLLLLLKISWITLQCLLCLIREPSALLFLLLQWLISLSSNYIVIHFPPSSILAKLSRKDWLVIGLFVHTLLFFCYFFHFPFFQNEHLYCRLNKTSQITSYTACIHFPSVYMCSCCDCIHSLFCESWNGRASTLQKHGILYVFTDKLWRICTIDYKIPLLPILLTFLIFISKFCSSSFIFFSSSLKFSS